MERQGSIPPSLAAGEQKKVRCQRPLKSGTRRDNRRGASGRRPPCSSPRARAYSSDSAGAGSMRKATAKLEPTRAIQTTETAEGTRTMNMPKWSFARRKPKAEDFIDVSIATVRHVFSEYPS